MTTLANVEPSLWTGKTKHITAKEFDEWLCVTAPGDQLVYVIGDLALALHQGGAGHSHLVELHEVTRAASESRFVCLAQRRIQYLSEATGQPAVFEYVATRRK